VEETAEYVTVSCRVGRYSELVLEVPYKNRKKK
jgi:hypothetical protein